MEQYNITGMSCAACASRIEKAVSHISGVTACSVSLLTNTMGVEGTASSAEIIKAVTDAGYGATLKGEKEKKSTQKAIIKKDDIISDYELQIKDLKQENEQLKKQNEELKGEDK